MKIRPMEAEMFHADRRTDVMKLTVAFRNFAKAPKTSRPNNHAKERKLLGNWTHCNSARVHNYNYRHQL